MAQAVSGVTDKANVGLTVLFAVSTSVCLQLPSGALLSSLSLPSSFLILADDPLLSFPELMPENTLQHAMIISDVLLMPVVDADCFLVMLADIFLA